MPKSDKISEKYVESVTILNNDPFFQEYMSQEEDQRKMQNSLIREAEDTGYEKGLKLLEKEKIKMVKNMLNEKIDINSISKIANLSIKEINEIKNKMIICN